LKVKLKVEEDYEEREAGGSETLQGVGRGQDLKIKTAVFLDIKPCSYLRENTLFCRYIAQLVYVL
jgi:hypothetical protein